MSDRLRNILIFGLLLIIVVVPTLAIYVLIKGSRGGEEFSPDNFTSRRFTYMVFPGTDWVLQGMTYDDTTSAACTQIVSDGLISTSSGPNQRWDLINDRKIGSLGSEFDARFLTMALAEEDSEHDSVWEKWTVKFPDSAKVLWPVIADLARDNMYLAVPEILDEVRDIKDDDAEAMQLQLDEYVATAYREFGEMDQQQSNHQRAVERLTRSIEVKPTRETYILRANSYDELGKKTLGDADRRSAQQNESSNAKEAG